MTHHDSQCQQPRPAEAKAHPHPHRVYKYYDLLMVAFVTVLICSEFISAGKVARIGSFSFGAGVVFFPLSYLFGDILTEVYGYARSRKVIWAGFSALIFSTIMTWIILALPPDPHGRTRRPGRRSSPTPGGSWRPRLRRSWSGSGSTRWCWPR